MNSKERVRAALSHQKPDRTPAAYQGVWLTDQKLMKHYGFDTMEQVYQKLDIDIRYADPRYIGPELKETRDEQGRCVRETYWGGRNTINETDLGGVSICTYAPLDEVETLEDLAKYTFPSPDWFDYTSITEACDRYPDKAIVIGHPGPFQVVTNLISMENLFMLMVDEPEVVKGIFDGLLNFELEYYRRAFEAGGGRVDILRPHDDYGTQISMLFSMDMWREFFKENTKKLVELTHKYNAFYMQHSCGAIAPVIPELIECGVDVLEPIQKTVGLEIDRLDRDYHGQIAFHGGVDTQWLLPTGTPEEVKAEAERIIQTLGKEGGYILMSSQAFESDVPVENIEAVYTADRIIR